MIDSRVGPLDLDAAVDGYLRYGESLRSDAPDAVSDPDDEAAWNALEAAIRRAPPAVAWELVVTLLRRAPDERLDVYAAGPLEELVIHRAAELVCEIEAEAERDARFRWALGCIWLSRGELPDAVLHRVVRASGGEIKLFPPLEELRRMDEAAFGDPSADDSPPS